MNDPYLFPEHGPHYPSSYYYPMSEQDFSPDSPDYLAKFNAGLKLVTLVMIVYQARRIKLFPPNPFTIFKDIYKLMRTIVVFVVISYIIRMIRASNPIAYIVKKVLTRAVITLVINFIPVIGQMATLAMPIFDFFAFMLSGI